jgi:hypothetical protein
MRLSSQLSIDMLRCRVQHTGLPVLSLAVLCRLPPPPSERAAEEKRLQEAGIPGDVDFQRMIRQFRDERGGTPYPHIPPGDLKICICVRKRPVNEKEKRRKDYDAVTCVNPKVSLGIQLLISGCWAGRAC